MAGTEAWAEAGTEAWAGSLAVAEAWAGSLADAEAWLATKAFLRLASSAIKSSTHGIAFNQGLTNSSSSKLTMAPSFLLRVSLATHNLQQTVLQPTKL